MAAMCGVGVGLAALALVAGCARGGGPAAAPVATGPVAFVSDEAGSEVVVVDVGAGRVLGRIAVGARPRGLVLSPDRRRLYVAIAARPPAAAGSPAAGPPSAAALQANRIAVIDVATRTVGDPIPIGGDPESLALTPDGAALLVTSPLAGTLTVVGTGGHELRARIALGGEPSGLAVSPDGGRVFVALAGQQAVAVLDLADGRRLGTIATGLGPRAVILARDGRTGFVADELGRDLTRFDAVALTPLGRAPLHLDSPMPAGPRPFAGILSRDGSQLYLGCGRGGSVAIVDVAGGRQLRSIDGVGGRPWGLALAGDGTLLVTANGTSEDLAVVNLTTGNVDRRVHLGGLPWGVVVATP